MAELILEPRHYNNSNDRILRSKWYLQGNALSGISRYVAADKDRIGLNIMLRSLGAPVEVLFGGPTGINGGITFTFDADHRHIILLLNVTDHPLLVTSDVWIEDTPNVPTGGIVEVYCCQDKQ